MSRNSRSVSKKPNKPYGLRRMPDGETIMQHVKELILPTAPNQYGTTALVDSDFYVQLLKHLTPYNTIGNQTFHWRAQGDSMLTQMAGSASNIAFNFQLSTFNGYTDFSATFDMYRLRAVSVRFDPMYKIGNLGTTNINPRLYTVIDYDDSNTIAPGSLVQYDSCVVTPPDCGVVRTLIPRMALAAYAGGVFTSFANAQDQWIDIASPSVQHYGVKASLDPGNAGQTSLQSFTVHIEAFWQFRATR